MRRYLLQGLLVLALLSNAVAADPPAYQADTGSEQPSEVRKPLSTVAEILATFDEQYRPETFEQESLNAAKAMLSAAKRAQLPSGTFSERLSWDDYSALTLEFGASVELPLLSTTAPLELELAELDLTARQLTLGSARADARAALLLDIASLSAWRWAFELTSDALAAIGHLDHSWLEESNASSGYVPPETREAFDQYLKLQEAHAWFEGQVEEVERRLERELARPVKDLRLPSLEDVDDYLSEIAPRKPEPIRCRLAAPRAHQAEIRSKAAVVHDELRSSTDYTVALIAELDYAFAPWPRSAAGSAAVAGNDSWAAGDLDVAISLEAHIPLPASWPLAGNATFSVAPERMEQGLNIAWPPLPTSKLVPVDREEERRIELADLLLELRALERAYSQSVDDRKLAARRLTWAVIDVAPTLSPDSLHAAVARALSRPVLEFSPLADGGFATTERALFLVELRIQHLFASIAELSARTYFLSACGEL